MKIMKLSIFYLVWLFLIMTSSECLSSEIWYQDNSFGMGRTLPDDFIYKFENIEIWERAINELDVYMFRVNIFNDNNFPMLTDAFITNLLLEVLREHDVKIALNTAGPLLSGCRDRSARIDKEFDWLARIKNLGMKIDYVSLQSILSKPSLATGKASDCPLEDRVNGAVIYAKRFAAEYPEVEFGLIDALPSHGKPYREAYKYIRDRFRKEGLKFGYIHLDLSAEMIWSGLNGLSWRKVIEVEEYVDRLDLKFGFIFTSRKSGQVSDKAFYQVIVKEHQDYLAAGGSPDDKIITSWFSYPKQSVRSKGESGGYPMTDLIWEFTRIPSETKYKANSN